MSFSLVFTPDNIPPFAPKQARWSKLGNVTSVKNEPNANVYSTGRTSATTSRGSGSSVPDGTGSALGSRQKGKTHPSRVITRNRRRVRISSVGNGRRRKRVSGSRYGEGSVSKENSVCYANERNHLQPLKHQTCFNYTLISSINTPHSGRAGRRRVGADNYQPTPDYTRRQRRGEGLKNVRALTVAAKPKGAAVPSWRPLLKHSKASDGRSGRSQAKTLLTEKMSQFSLLSPLKASKVECSSPQELASPR